MQNIIRLTGYNSNIIIDVNAISNKDIVTMANLIRDYNELNKVLDSEYEKPYYFLDFNPINEIIEDMDILTKKIIAIYRKYSVV